MLQHLTRFAQYDYTLYTVDTGSDKAEVVFSSGLILFFMVIYIAVLAFLLVAIWKVFVKANRKGWEALIPFYSLYVMLKIVGRPGWWFWLYFIPLVNLVIAIMVMYDFARSFGKDIGYTILLMFLPFIGYPMLAWGKATYKGPVHKG